jgi:hypothetical protein
MEFHDETMEYFTKPKFKAWEVLLPNIIWYRIKYLYCEGLEKVPLNNTAIVSRPARSPGENCSFPTLFLVTSRGNLKKIKAQQRQQICSPANKSSKRISYS